MNFDISGTSWQTVSNLTDDKNYFIQAKIKVNDEYVARPFMYSQSSTEPSEENEGITTKGIKFKKRENESVYIRSFGSTLNIQVEEV